MSYGGIPEYRPRPQLPTEYVALGVVLHEGRILVALRKANAFLGGLWEFPGGKREAGESYAACVVRELREECGIEVKPVRELLPVRHDYSEKRVVLQPYLCHMIGGSPSACASQKLKWVTLEELASLKVPDASRPIIARLIEETSRDASDPICP